MNVQKKSNPALKEKGGVKEVCTLFIDFYKIL